MNPFHHLLVPVDFSDATQPAVDLAVSLARAADARITLLHAFDVTPFVSGVPFVPTIDTGPIVQALEKDLTELRDAARATWPKIDGIVATGGACDVILATAVAMGCDLIVIGTHGRRGLPRALLGSVAERVVRLSPVPVLTLRPPPHAASGEAAR
jgi:nucleotide-binding universal stress UspA family protein